LACGAERNGREGRSLFEVAKILVMNSKILLSVTGEKNFEKIFEFEAVNEVRALSKSNH
jgi:hypothetical protein